MVMSRLAGIARDVGMSARIGVAALTSWVVPEPAWLPLARAIGRIQVRAGSGGRASATPFDETLAGPGRPAASFAVERIASGHASRLWGLREYVRRRRDFPIKVVGMAVVEEAVANGAGAILWVGRFTWASIITKMGLAGAGLAVTHLSRPTHGFATSPFAIRRLNPIWTRIEERFLHERIVMEAGAETAALRTLRERLEANRVVSISVGHEGARVVTVPFLGGTLQLATGPASLAAASGAPLLPVFTVAEGDLGFRVEIERPLEVPADEAREDREQRVAEGYAARLEPWVRRFPGQWLG
jgi:lauroyl/myristoyl acyltransferase